LRRHDETYRGLARRIRHGDFADGVAHREERRDIRDFRHRRKGSARRAVQDGVVFLLARIADDEFEEETVELRFGQRIRAFLLDRVLRREHGERLRKRTGFAARRHLQFLHGFEERGLRLRRRAVDFVGEHEVRVDRSLWRRSERRPPSSSSTIVPTTSVGMRSGVNWMRDIERSSAEPSAFTSAVLPIPGTPSRSACPPANSAVSVPVKGFVLSDDHGLHRVLDAA
jgi:hypothetical protein